MSRRRPGFVVSAAPTVVLTLVVGFVLPVGCGGSRFNPARPDVVLVVVDTLRADHLGAYGYRRPTSPRIDALASRGTLFEKAWSTAPWTLPSVMSIVTSRYPSSHRVENDGLKLAASIPTLAETMRAAGYATGAFVAHVYVGRQFGFDRGFDAFDDFGVGAPGYRPEARMEPTADRVTAAAAEWVRAQGSRPLFLLVHYFDPHWPYDPPEKYRAMFPSDYAGPLDAGYDAISRFKDPLVAMPEEYRRFLVDRYDGEIRFVDDEIGRLTEALEKAGRGSRAFVIVTGDHGEEFKEHGSIGHGRQLYEEVIRVPLIIAGPPGGGLEGGADAAARRVATPVSGIDLFPTVLDLAGIGQAPPGLQGTSLAPLARAAATGHEGTPPGDRPLVSETARLNACRKAVRIADLKLIDFMDENRSELYDLAGDPAERRDLSGQRVEDRRRLGRELFSTVDLLSGGWNVLWSGGGRRHRFQGQITTDGIFRTVVPMFRERGRYRIDRGNTLSFTDADQDAESGLSFTTAPYEAKVTFYLLIDGVPRLDKVFLGGRRMVPPAMPFALAGDARGEFPFTRPPHEAGRELGVYLWRNRPAGRDEQITLDDEIRQRLRSLGYVN
jgi:arylsulfatase A-like enzyme